MDLRPSTTTSGIQFSFTDTTVEEDTYEVSRLQVQQLTQIHTITNCCLSLSALGS
jgi:hypothetical protein